ncbi:hypothetical protein [Streptomyces sp. YGL11-2]|uniref:hypothetical protein n=1 Tax=Streptomyces sp. YGL11-2 TaxID=3414028 RepID=UPI003CF6CAC7
MRQTPTQRRPRRGTDLTKHYESPSWGSGGPGAGRGAEMDADLAVLALGVVGAEPDRVAKRLSATAEIEAGPQGPMRTD